MKQVTKISNFYYLCGSDNVPFYVGCTSKPIEERLSGHIAFAKCGKTAKSLKDKKLIELGFCVNAVMIESISYTYLANTKHLPYEALDRERELINQYLLKYPLLNQIH